MQKIESEKHNFIYKIIIIVVIKLDKYKHNSLIHVTEKYETLT